MPTWTQADVAALRAAVASGVLSVRYDGPPARAVTYQSLDAMRALLASMMQDVARGQGKQPGFRLASTSKGFRPSGAEAGGYGFFEDDWMRW